MVERADLRTGHVGYDGSAASQRIFQVITSVGTADESVVFAAVNPHTSVAIPALLDAHPTRYGLYASNLDVRWTSQLGTESIVTVTYGYIQNLLPWEQPAIYNWSQNPEQRTFDKDITSAIPVLNSAHQPFDPGVQMTRYAATMEVQVNMLTSSLPDLRGYVGCVNSGTFHGFARITPC